MRVNDENTMMDQVDIENGKSLGDLILELAYPLTGSQLFHSVSKTWNSSKYTFHFTPANRDIAIMIAKGLISYLKHVYGEWTNIFFDGTLVIAKMDWYCDVEKLSIVSPSA